MISPLPSAVSNCPMKKPSAAMLRLLVTIVAPSACIGRRKIGSRVVVGDRSADRSALTHRRIADQAGEVRNRRDHARGRSLLLAISK